MSNLNHNPDPRKTQPHDDPLTPDERAFIGEIRADLGRQFTYSPITHVEITRLLAIIDRLAPPQPTPEAEAPATPLFYEGDRVWSLDDNRYVELGQDVLSDNDIVHIRLHDALVLRRLSHILAYQPDAPQPAPATPPTPKALPLVTGDAQRDLDLSDAMAQDVPDGDCGWKSDEPLIDDAPTPEPNERRVARMTFRNAGEGTPPAPKAAKPVKLTQVQIDLMDQIERFGGMIWERLTVPDKMFATRLCHKGLARKDAIGAFNTLAIRLTPAGREALAAAKGGN